MASLALALLAPLAALDYNCTLPPLRVTFADPVSDVTCGARTLTECPTSPTQKQPLVVCPACDPTAKYTALMLDPDAPAPNDPASAPIRHWVAGNIDGADLQSGFSNISAGVDTLQDYTGPNPPPGSKPHRYGVFLFEQPNGHIAFAPITADRTKWDYQAFLNQYQLGAKISSDYFLCSV